VLLQSSLTELGIKTRIEKIPGANFRNAMLEKNRAIHVASFGGWLNFPDYCFLLGLSRAKRAVQHDVLPEPGIG
jgi:peptide/nickel transport system substrate-binding protein